jgi:hypothetical protein
MSWDHNGRVLADERPPAPRFRGVHEPCERCGGAGFYYRRETLTGHIAGLVDPCGLCLGAGALDAHAELEPERFTPPSWESLTVPSTHADGAGEFLGCHHAARRAAGSMMCCNCGMTLEADHG